MPTHPRDFYVDYVKRAYDEWLALPLDEYRAKGATHQANVMADRVWDFFRTSEPAKVFNCTSPNAYRKALAARECPDFALVWKLDDAFKHATLTRGRPQVTSADQTGIGQRGYGEGGYGEGMYGGGEEMLIELNDGTKSPLTAVMSKVIAMWERLVATF